MGLGIQESSNEAPVPGTALMTQQHNLPDEYQNIPRDFFKHGSGKHKDLILLPQPSDSPNDPLNWPQSRKETIIIVLSLNAAVVGAFGPMLSPGFVAIARELGVTVETIAQSTAWAVLSIGLSLLVVSPIAKVYGRRPLFVLSSAVMLGASVWGAVARAYGALLGVRVAAGVGMAPYETLVQCVIGDIFFVHERATRIAVWNLLLFAGVNGGSTVSAYIIEAAGFRWAFGACAVVFGVLLLAVLLLLPETAYRRDALAPVISIDDEGQKGLHMRPRHQINLQGDDYQGRYIEISVAERSHTYLDRLRIFNGRFSASPFWKIALRSIVMLFFPAVIWAFLTYGIEITWVIIFSVVNTTIFVAPPYSFSVSQIGLISLSPLVLCIVGYIISGPLNDRIAIYLTKRNRGIYEPEFRLPLMAVSVVLGTIGYFGFGLTVHYETHWTGPVLCFGAAYMSLVFASTCVFGYVLDAYRRHNAEAFVAINSRNLLSFGLTYFVNDWLAAQGPLRVFCTLGGIYLACSALTIPLWVYGKRIRSRIGRIEWLKRLMED